MSPPERQEMLDALAAIDARITHAEEKSEAFRADILKAVNTIQGDMDRIKGMARLAAWLVSSAAGILLILSLALQVVHQP